ncbi:AaceriADL339Wp [[Ashbya] aceris (nom. inval.)]|nr:AaceriADL339Wp [[Ashbya] aceris (nom. inval.)]
MKLIISSSCYQAQICDLLPCNDNCKSQLIHGMLCAYGLLQHFDKVITAPYATKHTLNKFHSMQYLSSSLDPRFNRSTEDCEDWAQVAQVARRYREAHGSSPQELWHSTKAELYRKFVSRTGYQGAEEGSDDDGRGAAAPVELARYGLVDDCPVVDYLPMYIHTVAGATLALAKELSRHRGSVLAVNWDGGRHHALKARASGFCYVNDIALLIQTLRRQGFLRVSYVDFDLHHGDGVENAFRYSKNVQTCSLHLFEPGFFPGTGAFKNCTENNVLNVPLLHGVDDRTLDHVIDNIVAPAVQRHDPEVLIIQCGGDGLAGDKYGEWQLSIHGLTRNILKLVQAHKFKKIALLGGGGYNARLQSRFYVYLTSMLISQCKGIATEIGDEEDELIRDHELIEMYEHEDYKFWYYEYEGLNRKNLLNDNTPAYMEKLLSSFN